MFTAGSCPSPPPPPQVVSAKIVAKSRTKQLRFGFVTMETPEEAERCIRELSGTELKGKKITVELVRHVTCHVTCHVTGGVEYSSHVRLNLLSNLCDDIIHILLVRVLD